jgi:hypothetical protein
LQNNKIPEAIIEEAAPLSVTISANGEESSKTEQQSCLRRLKENKYSSSSTSEIISDLEAILPMAAYSRYNSKF